MKEIFLHHLWKEKRLPFPQLRLVTGQPLLVKDVGKHNENKAGPDFEMAAVAFDEMTFVGPIEIHVSSSDWYKHNHHLDDNYNNVILHIVHNHDTEIIQNGRQIPTLELKSFLPRNWMWVNPKVEIPCRLKIDFSNLLLLESMKSKAWYLRCTEKLNLWFGNEFLNNEEVLFRSLLAGMGTGVNSQSFLLLSQSIGYSEVKGLSALDLFSFLQVRSMEIPDLIWHNKGVRPANFPSKRLKEFSELIASYRIFNLLDAPFESGWDFAKNEFQQQGYSRFWSNHLIINALVPFWLQSSLDKSEIWEKVEERLCQLPAEKNAVTRKWSSSEVRNKNAFDSQGLLALYRYYCKEKLCFECEVGNKLMKE